MKKVVLAIVLLLLGLSTATHYFGERKVSLEKVREVEKRFLKMATKQAFYEKPTLLTIDLGSGEFSKVSLECGTLLVLEELFADAEYSCVEGRIEVLIFDNRLFLSDRSSGNNKITPSENFNFLVNALNTLPNFREMREMTPSEFEYTAGLLANKWLICRNNDEIFHVSADSLEMILTPPGEIEGLWDAMVFGGNKFYSVILHPEDPDIDVEEAAKLIASFRLGHPK